MGPALISATLATRSYGQKALPAVWFESAGWDAHPQAGIGFPCQLERREGSVPRLFVFAPEQA